MLFLILVPPLRTSTCRRETGRQLSIEPVPIVSVIMPAAVSPGDSLVLEVTCGTPTPCWEFHRSEVARADSAYAVVVYAAYDGRPCIQIPGNFTTRITVPPPDTGKHVFTFRQAEGRVLTKAVIVR
jgi:hypothetical protein